MFIGIGVVANDFNKWYNLLCGGCDASKNELKTYEKFENGKWSDKRNNESMENIHTYSDISFTIKKHNELSSNRMDVHRTSSKMSLNICYKIKI